MRELVLVPFLLGLFCIYVASMPARTRTEIVKDTSTLYNDKGEILQVCYAENAISKSSSVVGLTDGKVGFLLTRVPLRSKLVLHNPRITYNAIDVAGERLMMAFTGLPGDVKCMLRHANALCEDHRVNFGETMPLLMLIKELCRYATLSLHPSEDDQEDKIGRPLACKGILIGISSERYWDEEDEDEDEDEEKCHGKKSCSVDVNKVIERWGKRRMSLMVCEHSGTYYEASMAVIGKMDSTKINRLMQIHQKNVSLREVLLDAAKLLFEEKEEDGDKFGFLELHVLTIDEGERSGGVINTKSQMKSIDDLSQFLNTCGP